VSTAIQWTDATWNPVVGCSPVSEGCRNCYAARHALRLAGNPSDAIRRAYEGTAEMRGAGRYRRAVFTGRVNLIKDRLEEPLRWRKPRRVFVNSMSDLFHEAVPVDFVAWVFGVMAVSAQHVFQVLTKRPDRMARVLAEELPRHVAETWPGDSALSLALEVGDWPLPNVWVGTSVEDQDAADERIPHLLRTPAAVRFLSCEPLLGPVDLRAFLRDKSGLIHWVIVGGESGPGARPCDISWIRSVVEQCRAAGVPVFVKQVGAFPYESCRAEGGVQGTAEALAKFGTPHPQRAWFGDGWTLTHTPDGESRWIRHHRLRDSKGGDPAEWPEDLRVREFPAAEVRR